MPAAATHLCGCCLLPRITPEQIKVGGSVQSAIEVSPFKRSGNTLSYGPYSDAAPWAAEQISGAWGCVGCQACVFDLCHDFLMAACCAGDGSRL